MPTHFRRWLTVCVLASAWSVVVSGCSRGPEIPATYSVSGKVTYKDQPLADAEIGFVSKLDNKDVKPARGKTNASGEFTLTTYIDPEHEVSGATLGEYTVTVVKVDIPDSDELMKQFFENPAFVPKKLIPEKYSDAKVSPLTADVKKDGPNTFEFKLED